MNILYCSYFGLLAFDQSQAVRLQSLQSHVLLTVQLGYMKKRQQPALMNAMMNAVFGAHRRTRPDMRTVSR